MSGPLPPPLIPLPADKPWWQQKTTILATFGIIAASCIAIAQQFPQHAPLLTTIATIIGIITGNLGSVTARQGGVERAEQAADHATTAAAVVAANLTQQTVATATAVAQQVASGECPECEDGPTRGAALGADNLGRP